MIGLIWDYYCMDSGRVNLFLGWVRFEFNKNGLDYNQWLSCGVVRDNDVFIFIDLFENFFVILEFFIFF